MKRLCGAALAAMALGGLLSGCGQPSNNAPASASNGAATANVGPASATPASLSNEAAAPGSPACRAGDLALARVNEDAGAGHRVVTYSLANNGPAACSLTGYPTLTLLDADGNKTGAVSAVETDQAFYNIGGPPQPVTLAPNGKAVFFVSFAGIQATDKPCTAISKLQVVPPGNTQAIELADTLQVCTGELHLSPIRPNQGATTASRGNGNGPLFY